MRADFFSMSAIPCRLAFNKFGVFHGRWLLHEEMVVAAPYTKCIDLFSEAAICPTGPAADSLSRWTGYRYVYLASFAGCVHLEVISVAIHS